MTGKLIVAASLATAIAVLPASPIAAGNSDFAAGILTGVIGSAIVRDVTKQNRARRNAARNARKQSNYKQSNYYSSVRAANVRVQTSLNYFGFPAGYADGVLGHRSRAAIASYQGWLGYPVTGRLTAYQRDFLVNSYSRALAGGAATAQQIAADPRGARGLLLTWRNELAGAAPVAPQGSSVPAPTGGAAPQQTTTTATLPNLLGGAAGSQVSLASSCNKVGLVTGTNGYMTAANMTDPALALNEQFCLARTYAIAQGEDLAAAVQGYSKAQIEQQCAGFGPAMKEQIAALSLKPRDAVLHDVSQFVLTTGLPPAQIAGTAKICLSVGYRKDEMGVALASALILTTLGEPAYGELIADHLATGFGVTRRPDLALGWYQMSFDAIANGSKPVFAPGQPERIGVVRKAAYAVAGQPLPGSAPVPASLPTFNLAPNN